MQTVLLVVHLLIALGLVGIILIQKSEGGGLGIGGGGTSGPGSIFSARGVGNALTRTTAWLAVAFFATSVSLTLLATRGNLGGSAFDRAQPAASQPAPTSQPGQQNDGAVLPNLGQTPSPTPTQPQVPTNQ